MKNLKGVSRENAKVYTYIRVSTAMQVERYSLKAQQDIIMREAERYNMTVVQQFADEGKSGKTEIDRPAFMEMMENIRNKKDDVSFVIVFKLSRFGRKTSEILHSVEEMRKYNVHLICVDDGIDTSTDAGRLLTSILGIVAEIERENILVQTMEGRRRKAREGLYNGGVTPYGYKVVDDRFVVDESEAEVVRIIFNKFTATSMGQITIAKWLNANGYKKRRFREQEVSYFTNRFITRLLRNPAYVGSMVFGRTTLAPVEGSPNRRVESDDAEVKLNAHEAIIDQETWDLAQMKLDGKGGKREKIDKEHEYLLSGLLRCPLCGRPLYGIPSRGKRKKDGTLYPTYYSYTCRNTISHLEKGKKCNFGQIASSKVDGQIRDILLTIVTAENFGAEMERLAQNYADVSEIEKRINNCKEKLHDAETKRKKLQALQFELDATSKHYKRNWLNIQEQLDAVFDELDNTEAQLEKNLDELAASKQQNLSKESIYKSLTIFGEVYDLMTNAEKKEFLNQFIQEIHLYPDKKGKNGCYVKSISFAFPVSYEGEEVYVINTTTSEDISSPPQGSNVETIVRLRGEKVDGHIHINFDLENLNGIEHLPIKDMGRSGGIDRTVVKRNVSVERKTFGFATYNEIKRYIYEKFGLKISTLHIAQMKAKYNIIERKNYNLGSKGNKGSKCSPEREHAIVDAFKYFNMI